MKDVDVRGVSPHTQQRIQLNFLGHFSVAIFRENAQSQFLISHQWAYYDLFESFNKSEMWAVIQKFTLLYD